MKFIITVDTEADNQWKRETELSVNNISFLPRFQDLCQNFGFYPTYLVTYEVAEDQAAADLLRKYQEEGRAEIGAHLHPWSTPPYSRDIEWERKHHLFPSELSEEELRSKMISLTEIIENNFGKRPRSFRAGRWGFDDKVLKTLKELDYIADSSITPGVSWKSTKGDPQGLGGPDFRKATIRPYEISLENIFEKGESGIIEAPITILPSGNMIERLGRKILGKPRWLRIFPETELVHLVSVYEAAKREDLPYIQFMTHSSELMPAGSPYTQNEAALEKTYVILKEFFEFLKKENVSGSTLSEFALSMKKAENRPQYD